MDLKRTAMKITCNTSPTITPTIARLRNSRPILGPTSSWRRSVTPLNRVLIASRSACFVPAGSGRPDEDLLPGLLNDALPGCEAIHDLADVAHLERLSELKLEEIPTGEVDAPIQGTTARGAVDDQRRDARQNDQQGKGIPPAPPAHDIPAAPCIGWGRATRVQSRPSPGLRPCG